ncbi:AAA family ATPase [Marinimicrobium sp. C2-29]|uniref:AAA family ATPase n=1 Tax=Marinimicrobium sp. C2-29 TaxID=3139825 RepID=UPI003139EE48
MLAYYYLYRPQLLILDEPDSHLHPNNQRVLAKLLTDVQKETSCQLVISTHSRHFFEAIKGDAKVHWVNNCSLVEDSGDLERSVLLEIGALDKGDQLRNGEVPCILLTEDTDPRYIELLAEASGFVPEEFEIWSYEGCSNINTALAINAFIAEHAPGTNVVVHRDRDYMSDEEVQAYKAKLEPIGIKVFITAGNDAEAHLVNTHHISDLYPRVTLQKVNELIEEVLDERRDAILRKYINTIHNRKLQASYKGGDRPDPGAIALGCTQSYDNDRRGHMHGKIVESALRAKLQAEVGGNIDLCRMSDHILCEDLQGFANEIWPEQE